MDEEETTICGLPDNVWMIRIERGRREDKLKDEKRSEEWDLKHKVD